jgi:hypothetical protein
MATKNRKRKIPVLNNDEQNIAKEQVKHNFPKFNCLPYLSGK